MRPPLPLRTFQKLRLMRLLRLHPPQRPQTRRASCAWTWACAAPGDSAGWPRRSADFPVGPGGALEGGASGWAVIGRILECSPCDETFSPTCSPSAEMYVRTGLTAPRTFRTFAAGAWAGEAPDVSECTECTPDISGRSGRSGEVWFSQFSEPAARKGENCSLPRKASPAGVNW